MANQHRYRSEIQRICEKGHWTADQIHKELKKTYFFIGIGTVYRTLQAMVDEKVLMKTP
jgi:Fe2+ or Zn2+ uptake regulation protein